MGTSSSSLGLDSDYSVRHQSQKASDIPVLDPSAVKHLERISQDVAAQVDQMLTRVHCILHDMAALSVGCIQTYKDSLAGLAESVETSLQGVYTLMALCEEMDRTMQPVHMLSQNIREIKGTLESFETLCK